MLLWMTPSEAPKALQASECSELLDPTRASCWISAQHQPGKFTSPSGFTLYSKVCAPSHRLSSCALNQMLCPCRSRRCPCRGGVGVSSNVWACVCVLTCPCRSVASGPVCALVPRAFPIAVLTRTHPSGTKDHPLVLRNTPW